MPPMTSSTLCADSAATVVLSRVLIRCTSPDLPTLAVWAPGQMFAR